MRRLITLAALTSLAALLVLPGLAGASHTDGNGDGPKDDFVNGTGQVGPPAGQDDQNASSELHVNARVEPPDAPLGGNTPTGRFFFRQADPGIDVSGQVTCLAVNDNRAIVGGRVDKSKNGGPINEGDGVVFEVIDNGEPGTQDEFNPFPVLSGQAPPPALCAFLLGGVIANRLVMPSQGPFRPSGGTITRGNFVVHEAP